MRFSLAPNKLVAILILTAVVGGFVSPVFALGDQTKAKTFIQTAEKASEITLEFVERARSSGTDVSRALSLVEEGNILLTQAKAAYDEGDYDSASIDAIIAQIRFRDALRTLGSERSSIEKEDRARLIEAIERARERIQRTREILDATDVGESQGQMKTKLDQAEELLRKAESILESDIGNISAAAREMAQAEKLIAEAFIVLEQASQVPNKHRIEAFLENMEKEIQRLRDDLEKLAMKGIVVDDLKSLVDAAESLLRSARGKTSDGDLVEILSDIHQARRIIEQVREQAFKRQRQGP